MTAWRNTDIRTHRFHAIFWPAFLMAIGLEPPKTVLAHAHWTMDRQKMSKSRGNVANPFEAMDTFGVDAVRYYLARVGGGLVDDAGKREQACDLTRNAYGRLLQQTGRQSRSQNITSVICKG